MYHLATVYPSVRRLNLPLTRDQLMLLVAAVNELFLSLDTYLAHSLNGTIRPREWIPIIFGLVAGILLLIAGLIATRRRRAASILATIVFITSVLIGILGAYFHLVRGSLPTGAAGQRITVDLLVWAPPVLAPFAFAGIGLLGLSAAWIEEPADSGRLHFSEVRRLDLPYSKTRAYFFLVSMGTLVALISSALDHARSGFENPWFWLPLAAGVFGTIVAAGMGALDRPSRSDVVTYTAAMLLLMLVGVIGAVLHIRADLTAQSVIVPERFLRGAPFLSPMLFANMGLVGLIALLDPAEQA